MLIKLRENVIEMFERKFVHMLQRFLVVNTSSRSHVTPFVLVLSLKEEDLQSKRSHYAVILLRLSQSLATMSFFFVQLWGTMTAGKFLSNQTIKQSASQVIEY